MFPLLSTQIRHILKENCYRSYLVYNAKGLKSFVNPAVKEPLFKWKKIGVQGILLLSIPIGTFCLGTWQVQRRKWKLQLIEELQSKTNEPPITFPENPEVFDELEYRKVKIRGVFHHDKEMFLGPRSLLAGGDTLSSGGGLISSGHSGYNVITPFTLSDKNLTILVNRGWVPRKFKNPSTRQVGQVTNPVELTGVVRMNEIRPPFMPENIKDSNIFCYRDVVSMARQADCAPIFLDIVETIEGGPEGGQTRVTLRNEHMSYIITWYALSASTAFLWFRKFVLAKPLM